MPLNGPELRDARARAGFATTEAFANAIGASMRAVQDWELGKSLPQARYRARINEVLGAATAAPRPVDPQRFAEIEAALDEATDMQILSQVARRMSRRGEPVALPDQPLRWPRTDDPPAAKHSRDGPA